MPVASHAMFGGFGREALSYYLYLNSAPWVHYGNGSFSAVSRLQIARVGAFFSIFQDLQDYNTSAPLRSQNLSRKVVTIFAIFPDLFKIFAFFEFFSANFAIFDRKFHENFSELRENA